MECDIKVFAGELGDIYKISKGDSTQELSSLDLIVEFISNRPSEELDKLKTDLDQAQVIVPEHAKLIFESKNVIGNSSVLEMLNKWPEETDGFIPEKKYIITLRDKMTFGGEQIYGRVNVKGITTYIIRNASDAENFVKTERKIALIEKNINGDEIQNSEYLEKKYLKKLLALKKHYKFDSIKNLLLDYLNNKSKYSEIVGTGKNAQPASYVLNDFCRELNGDTIIYNASDSLFLKALKQNNWKMDEFNKEDLYKIIVKFFPKYKEELSKNLFYELPLDKIKEIWEDIRDPSLMQYEISSVETNKKKLRILTDKQFEAKFKLVLKEKGLGGEISDYIHDIKSAKDFFDGYLKNVEIDGVNRNLEVSEKNGKILLQYYGIEYSGKIKLSKNSITLKDNFNFGYDTKDLFIPINSNKDESGNYMYEDGDYEIVDGKYNGMYIYKYTDPKTKQDLFIVSKSVIHPNAYVISLQNTLNDAKLVIDQILHNTKLNKLCNFGINYELDNVPRSVMLNLFYYPGSVILKLYFPLRNIKIGTFEKLIFNLNYNKAFEYYKDLSPIVNGVPTKIDTKPLDTGEKLGLFIHKLLEYGIDYSKLKLGISDSEVNKLKEMILDKYEGDDFRSLWNLIITNIKNGYISEVKNILQQLIDDVEEIFKYLGNIGLSNDNLLKINSIIQSINSAPTESYIVESIYQSDDMKKGDVWSAKLKSMKGVDINSSGIVVNSGSTSFEEGKFPIDSLTLSFYNLKRELENTLLKGSGIKIHIKNNDTIMEMEDEKGNKLFKSPSGIRAFIYDGDIYINLSNSDISDLIHESLHLLLGSIRVSNPDVYENIVEYFYNEENNTSKRAVENKYENLAKIDAMEEVAVNYIARNMYNGTFGYEDNMKNVMEEFKNRFLQMSEKVLKSLKIKPEMSQIQFNTFALNLLIDEDIRNRMKENRMISNAIEVGKHNGTIIENC